MHAQLLGLNEVIDAEYVKCLIKDVIEEIEEIKYYYQKKKMTDFAIGDILSEQDKKKSKYKDKMHKHCCFCDC